VNWMQRVVLVLGLLAIAAMGLYPPTLAVFVTGQDVGEYCYGAHQWVFWPPEVRYDSVEGRRFLVLSGLIDTANLLTRWAIVAAVTAALVLALKGRKKTERSDNED